jgi:hypothetical protein
MMLQRWFERQAGYLLWLGVLVICAAVGGASVGGVRLVQWISAG